MKNRKLLIIVSTVVLSNALHANSISIDDGKTIFMSRCAACHNVNVKVVGPALAGVGDRHNLNWIFNFVHSSQSLVKGNDKDAVTLFHQFNNMIMPDHPDLSDDQIQSILAYIKTQEKNSVNSSTSVVRLERPRPNYTPISISNLDFFGSYILLVLFLAACLLAAVRVKELQRTNTNDKGKTSSGDWNKNAA